MGWERGEGIPGTVSTVLACLEWFLSLHLSMVFEDTSGMVALLVYLWLTHTNYPFPTFLSSVGPGTSMPSWSLVESCSDCIAP